MLLSDANIKLLVNDSLLMKWKLLGKPSDFGSHNGKYSDLFRVLAVWNNFWSQHFEIFRPAFYSVHKTYVEKCAIPKSKEHSNDDIMCLWVFWLENGNKFFFFVTCSVQETRVLFTIIWHPNNPNIMQLSCLQSFHILRIFGSFYDRSNFLNNICQCLWICIQIEYCLDWIVQLWFWISLLP